jgi:hypothetical protein
MGLTHMGGPWARIGLLLPAHGRAGRLTVGPWAFDGRPMGLQKSKYRIPVTCTIYAYSACIL